MGFLWNALLATGFVVLALLFAPGLPPHHVKFESHTHPPPRELKGVLAKNTILDKAEPIKLDRPIAGPESIAIRGDELFTGIDTGELVKIKNGRVTTVAKFGGKCDGKWDPKSCGRIAGVRFDSAGKLLAADAAKGIFRVDVDTGASEQLVFMDQEIEGKLPKFPDDLDVGKDGSIYWSDASTTGDVDGMMNELLGEPSGRLVKYDPKTKTNTVLINGLHFGNGVQLSKNEDFVLIADMGRFRVMRYFLKGPRQGQSDVFVDQLPGLPDNLRPNGKGGFFIVMGMPRTTEDFDLIGTLGSLPLVRKFTLRLFTLISLGLRYVEINLFPSPKLREWSIFVGNGCMDLENGPSKVIIVETDEKGIILRTLQNEKGPIARISEMNLGKEYAYFGSASAPAIYRMKISELK